MKLKGTLQTFQDGCTSHFFLQFVLASAIQHSSFQFLYSNCRFDTVCFTNQHCSLKYSTSKFTQLNIQLSKMHVSDFQPQASQ